MKPRDAVLPFAATLLLTGCATEKVRALQKSMEPTIRSGEYVLVETDAYASRPPEAGDIVSARLPLGGDEDRCGAPPAPGAPCMRPTAKYSPDLGVIKRVVATGGQTVRIDRRGRAIVDGVRLPEPYLTPCEPGDRCALPRAGRVPEGFFFLLGDNRPYSSDSRYWGPVPREAIEGAITLPREDR